MNHKKEFKKIGQGLVLYVAIGAVVYFLKLPWWSLIIMLLVLQAALMLYIKKFSWKKLGKSFIYIVGIILLFRVCSEFGPLGITVGFGLLAVFIIIMRRKLYMEQLYKIETTIYGKPLHQFKEEGEKVPKLKFPWSK